MSELSGRLSDFALSQVLVLLRTGNKTGVLRIAGSIGEGSLNFNDGEIVHNPEDDTDLVDLLVSLARIPDATFVFESGVVSVGGPDSHHDPATVLPQLAERLDAWNELEETLGSAFDPYVTTAGADDGADLDLSGADWNLLASLGDGSSAAGLSRRLGLDEFETAQRLASFLTLGLIAPMSEGLPHRAPVPVGESAILIEPHIPLQPSEPTRQADVSSSVVLDLTEPRPDEAKKAEPVPEEDEPASELAARWRDLRSSRR